MELDTLRRIGKHFGTVSLILLGLALLLLSIVSMEPLLTFSTTIRGFSTSTIVTVLLLATPPLMLFVLALAMFTLSGSMSLDSAESIATFVIGFTNFLIFLMAFLASTLTTRSGGLASWLSTTNFAGLAIFTLIMLIVGGALSGRKDVVVKLIGRGFKLVGLFVGLLTIYWFATAPPIAYTLKPFAILSLLGKHFTLFLTVSGIVVVALWIASTVNELKPRHMSTLIIVAIASIVALLIVIPTAMAIAGEPIDKEIEAYESLLRGLLRVPPFVLQFLAIAKTLITVIQYLLPIAIALTPIAAGIGLGYAAIALIHGVTYLPAPPPPPQPPTPPPSPPEVQTPPPSPLPQQVEGKPEAPTVVAETGKTCPFCGKPIQPDALFCPYCGAYLGTDETKVYAEEGKEQAS